MRADVLRQVVFKRSDLLQGTMDQCTQRPRVDLADRFIHRDDAAGVQNPASASSSSLESSSVSGCIISQFAAIVIELDLPEQSDASADGQAICEVRPVKPLA